MRLVRPGGWLWRPAAEAVRVWVAIADHFEPLWKQADTETALGRVALWRKEWPLVADLSRDSEGQAARYSFFFPAEQYDGKLLEPLAELKRESVAEVEIHYHHGGETEAEFCRVMGGFAETLHRDHDLLRVHGGKIAFGFIHGNWALDNSLPNGEHCGLNNEITLLAQLGCYADFTMPSGDSPTQARMVNRVYWAKDDPVRPKSYDTGKRFRRGVARDGELLMIPGPFGLREVPKWRGPQVLIREKYPETGELASYHRVTPERVHYWLDLAPRVGNDIFVKLFTHGAQERHSAVLLGADGDLATMYRLVGEECGRRGWEFRFASTWEIYRRIEELAAE